MRGLLLRGGTGRKGRGGKGRGCYGKGVRGRKKGRTEEKRDGRVGEGVRRGEGDGRG